MHGFAMLEASRGCGFLLGGWLAWCLIPHPMGAVIMAGGL
jgi:hypothetical protein